MGYSLESDIDPSSITSCKLQLPQPVTAPNSNPSTYTLSVSQVNVAYEAKTVTPATAPSSGPTIVEATLSDQVVPPALDVTAACANAVDGHINLMLDSRGAPVTFPSSASNNGAKLIISTK
ncbi:hypothetical protein IWW36_004013 [Coemansia brasiliensis]|uniref:Uncharacterized protein n=1 Tax=Coemansia brasiliensis TaxID=2650707 RepID=A0A9W8LWN5_9FUNG|nr:hypothetical protein IWW36_004013 [Coemansia brasiliensis]